MHMNQGSESQDGVQALLPTAKHTPDRGVVVGASGVDRPAHGPHADKLGTCSQRSYHSTVEGDGHLTAVSSSSQLLREACDMHCNMHDMDARSHRSPNCHTDRSLLS